MRIVSTVTGLEYKGEQMVYIANPLQCARYIKHGARIYDVIEDNDKVFFVFKKSETSDLFDRWCRRELH